MTPEEAREFTQALGQIGAGLWRQIAWADRQGVPTALGLSTREWVEKHIGGYMRLSISERREAVAELTEEGMPGEQVAEVLGVTPMTVSRDRRLTNVRDHDEEPQVGAGPPLTNVREPEPPPPPRLTAAELKRADRERVRREAIERDAYRLRQFIDGWVTFSTLHTNVDRDDVLAALAQPDRDQIAAITRRIEEWNQPA